MNAEELARAVLGTVGWALFIGGFAWVLTDCAAALPIVSGLGLLFIAVTVDRLKR